MTTLIRWRSTVALAAALVLLFAASSAPAQEHKHSPAQAERAARAPRPQLASGVAFAPDGRLWLAGLDAQNQLFVQSTDQARGASGAVAWSAPLVLDTGRDAISADGENRPKLAFGPNGWVVISYTQPLAKPYTGMIRMLRSVDGGKSFSAPFTVHADRQEITHRFESIAFDAKGVLHTLWVDKRDLETAPKTGKKSSYVGAAIYRNASIDGGASFGPDIKLADHSCECCRIALSPGSDGGLRAMWRHVFDANVRDHGFAKVSQEGDDQVTRASFDDWHIDACPHHGPGLALAADGGFHAVWFGVRQQDGQGLAAVRYGRLAPDGAPLAATVRPLPDELAEHADLLSDGERLAIVWRSVDGARSTLKAWLSSDSGRNFRLIELGRVSGDNDHPRLARFGQTMVAVWRTAKEVQVHDIPF